MRISKALLLRSFDVGRVVSPGHQNIHTRGGISVFVEHLAYPFFACNEQRLRFWPAPLPCMKKCIHRPALVIQGKRHVGAGDNSFSIFIPSGWLCPHADDTCLRGRSSCKGIQVIHVRGCGQIGFGIFVPY